ncbi:hypothetical protein EGR_01958 [Echinococcus granulosus]|uniref:Uncharacterized protein n=1 Tax=Echinococcus granulosus TaxID=6210 RepID=W6V998_ECHGR|nr:hypothetical protein EGR_01958 [Echinococcus granulosus]EUB63154.1 hypothetical protein EGR_01958 [Echinococcus granulosus]
MRFWDTRAPASTEQRIIKFFHEEGTGQQPVPRSSEKICGATQTYRPT